MALYRWLRAERLQVNADYRENGVDCRNAMRATTKGGERRLNDVRNVGRHFGPYRDPCNLCYPTGNFRDQIRVLAHGGAHLALRHTVWAREVQFEPVDTGVLNHSGQFLPTLFIVFLHNRGDKDV